MMIFQDISEVYFRICKNDGIRNIISNDVDSIKSHSLETLHIIEVVVIPGRIN